MNRKRSWSHRHPILPPTPWDPLARLPTAPHLGAKDVATEPRRRDTGRPPWNENQNRGPQKVDSKWRVVELLFLPKAGEFQEAAAESLLPMLPRCKKNRKKWTKSIATSSNSTINSTAIAHLESIAKVFVIIIASDRLPSCPWQHEDPGPTSHPISIN